MGSASATELRLTNCIVQKLSGSQHKSFEQYDNYGNIIYYYKRVYYSGQKQINIYNADQKEIGKIRTIINSSCSNNIFFTFTDENNNIINYIDKNECCSSIYTFYDSNKNIESVVTFKVGCKLTYEESDKYNTIINRADINNYCCSSLFNEYDQYGNLTFKTKIFEQMYSNIIKFFDSYDNEVNINDKTLLNKGFTKIQLIILLEFIFRR